MPIIGAFGSGHRMNALSSTRMFRLAPGKVECGEEGPRVAGTPLLSRNSYGRWAPRDAGDVGRQLSKLYGFPLDFGCKREGLAAIARALESRDLARAQIATLLLKLPDPAELDGAVPDALQRRLLARDLAASGLLKAGDDWDAQHPRTGTSPNPGWFASKPDAAAPPKADAAPLAPSAAAGAEALRPSTAAEAASLLSRDLAPTVLDALGTLAARMSEPTLLFDTIFVPSANQLVDEGPVPGRPDMAYRWAHDETSVTFSALVDGEWRPLTGGALRGNVYLDENGEPVAVSAPGPDGRTTLVTSVDVLDRALGELKARAGDPGVASSSEDHEPKLCPDPVPEPKTTTSQNSITYQEYVSKLPYGLAIRLGGVIFDGCDPTTGDLLEAKANIDFMFDGKDDLHWVYDANNPKHQMTDQASVGLAYGRRVVWRVQTEKGFRGLTSIAKDLGYDNLFVVYDPNGKDR
jgi:hypothetical protein